MPLLRRFPALRSTVGPALVMAVIQAALVLLLAWPAGQTGLHGAPLVIAGPDAIASVARKTFESGSPGTWSITVAEKETDARRAVLERRAYGALVIDDDGLTLLVASAASPAIAQRLGQAVDAIQARSQGTTLTVEDLAPSPARDPHGAAIAPALLALLVTSSAFGVLVLRRWSRSARDRASALAVFGVGAGLSGAFVLHVVLGAITGPFAAEAGVLTLLALASAGLPILLGFIADLPGAVLGAVLVVPVGFPISGAVSAPELVPTPWGALGSYLPAGAGTTALRSVAFFHGWGALTSLLVLAAWTVLGLVALAAPALRARLAARIVAGTRTREESRESEAEVVGATGS